MEITEVSEIPKVKLPHKNIDLIEKFIRSEKRMAMITDGDRPAINICWSLKTTIRINPYYRKTIYVCMRNGKVYIARLGE